MIRPSDSDIEGILTKSDRKYSIPHYQRNFDWGKSELQELIDDLKETSKSDTKQLFLGNFIFDVSDDKNYEIVDGQQRLTTISLIALAIREHAKKINETGYAGEMQKYISAKATWSKEHSNRITVAPNIRDIFEHMSNAEWDGTFPDKVSGRSIKRQVNKVKPIYTHVLSELKTYSIEDLMSFTRALMTSYVVIIGVQDTDDVFAIFERTNARGLDLNIGDLLKNFILSQTSDEYTDQWNELIQNADGTVPKMFKYFWVVNNGHVRQSELYKSLKSKALTDGMSTFIDDLYTFSKFYRITKIAEEQLVTDWLSDFGLTSLAENEDHSKRITRVLQGLRLFRITQATPVLFALFALYKSQKVNDPDKLIYALEAIEKYHFVNNVIASRIGNDVEMYYSEKAPDIFKSERAFRDVVLDLVSDLRQKKASKQEFVASFVESTVYDDKNLGLLAYIYDRINNFGTKGAQIVKIYTPEKVGTKRDYNVDHILPQKFKDNYTLEEQELFDHIGNLLVISRHSNSEFQHKSPALKKELITSDKKHFGNLRYMDDFLKDYDKELDDWNFDAILKRSKDMANSSYDQIWQF